MFTKTFLLRASSIAIRLNPVAIAATFAFSTLMDFYRQGKREEEVVAKVEQLVHACRENVEVLVGVHEECVGLMGPAIRGEEWARRELVERVRQVMEVDWLEVERYQDEDSWEVVVLGGDPEQATR